MNIKTENMRLRGILLGAMAKGPMTRDELLSLTAERYVEDGTEHSPAEAEELTHTVRSLAGTVLGALYREKQVTRDQNGRYSPAGDVSKLPGSRDKLPGSPEKLRSSPDKLRGVPGTASGHAEKISEDADAKKNPAKPKKPRKTEAGTTQRTAQGTPQGSLQKPVPATPQETNRGAAQAPGKTAENAKPSKTAQGKPKTTVPPSRTSVKKTPVSPTGTTVKTVNPPETPAKQATVPPVAPSEKAEHTPTETDTQSGRIAEEIRGLLSQKPLRRGEIFKRLDEIVGTEESKADAERLHHTAGDILKRMKDTGVLSCSFGVYRLTGESAAKNNGGASSGTARTSHTADTDKLRKMFLTRLHAHGGLYLEQYAMNLLIKYYQDSGKVICSSRVTGGSEDGGIDGVLEVKDWLGFRECVMIQAKCRSSIQVSEKEIREFYGVVCSGRGSRGIFITTSTFHESAQRLLSTIDNCVGIDGEKLFSMARRCHYGIREGARGEEVDPEVI